MSEFVEKYLRSEYLGLEIENVEGRSVGSRIVMKSIGGLKRIAERVLFG